MVKETTLITKSQYKRSEKGEYHNASTRNIDDTITLLLNYPWDIERSLASIDINSPGITIEHFNGTYLKVGPYFSGKFSLHYLKSKYTVQFKITNTLEEACLYLKAYFEDNGKMGDFENYGFYINANSYFQTKSFEYTINTKAVISFFKFPIILSLILLLMFSLKFLASPLTLNFKGMLFMMFFLLVLFSPLIFFFFNYVVADRAYYLKISKGHDEFIYGTKENKKTYYKKNIAEITAHGMQDTRSLWRECEIFVITFTDGEQIKFTSLLISGNTFRKKFASHLVKDHRVIFPTVNSV